MSTWATICAHVTGLVVGPVLAALWQGGLIERMRSHAQWSLPDLAVATSAQLGPLAVVMRGLECEGLVWRSGGPGIEQTLAGLTGLGQEVTSWEGLPGLLKDLGASLGRSGLEQEFQAERSLRWRLPDTAAGARWALFLDGFLALEPMLRLHREGRCRSDLLRSLGWIDSLGEKTERGVKAAKLGYTYLFPWSYQPLLGSLDSLLFGQCRLFEREHDQPESHLSRSEDISFSGTLSAEFCAACAYPGLRTRFDQLPLDRQPQFLADTGCGDGRLLAALGRFVAGSTRRGQHLERYPLWLVGVDQEAIARAAARHTLEATGLPFRVLAGDIADPDGLAEAIKGEGLDPYRGLHFSKSVFHDRTYRQGAGKTAGRLARSTGAFIDQDCRPVDNALLEQNLVETAAAWAPYCREHGMLLFEAHTASPSVIADNLHRNWSPAFDIVQGLSRQYPVELEVLHGALVEAGFQIDSWLDPTQGFCGFPTMSMTWLSCRQ